MQDRNPTFTLLLDGNILLNDAPMLYQEFDGRLDLDSNQYWPAGFYDVEIKDLLNREIHIRSVEVKSARLSFVELDHQKLLAWSDSLEADAPLVLCYDEIAPSNTQVLCTLPLSKDSMEAIISEMEKRPARSVFDETRDEE